MKRRPVILAAVAAALATPNITRARESTVLRFVPEADLAVIDPVLTSASVTRNFSIAVFDTLFGLDASYAPQPQMVERFGVEADGLVWTLELRAGLRFHDGTPVLARDCIASIARWGRRDAFGQALMAATVELAGPDDKTIRFRLKHPFPLLPAALGKVSANICAIMPERLARTDPYTAIAEAVGSGPFRHVVRDRVPGAFTVLERFQDYVPRSNGTSELTAGPKISHLDRVEWTVISDPSTAAGALQTGQVDWWEAPAFDLLDTLKRSTKVNLFELDPSGQMALMRFNHLHPPFDNPAIRRALLSAVDQTRFMRAVAGDQTSLWHVPAGFFPPGTPLASQAGMSALPSQPDFEKVRADLTQAGYAGERVVVLVATDIPAAAALGYVGADLLRQAGMNIDTQTMDWGSIVQRRASRESVEKGGWSVFFTTFPGLDQSTPAGHLALRGSGSSAWFGWPTDTKMETLRQAWFEAPTIDEQKAVAAEMQREAFITLPYMPLGQLFQPTAMRMSVTGVLSGLPIFWNLRKQI